MTARLRTSFRSGNLAEHLGLLLLKGIAAVADPARPEDIGLDAIATLLRPDNDGNCYAEDSFLVQLKTESVKSIQYNGHELDWFVAQKHPLFIGLVSLANSQISLYPTLFVNHAVLALHAKNATIRFGASQVPPFLRGQKWGPWKAEGDAGATVWLGAPLLQWTLSDLVDNDWKKRTYENLKRFMTMAHRELELLSFGQCSVLDWSTNDAASITSQSGMMKSNPANLQNLAQQCLPGINALMLSATAMPEESGNSLMIPMLALVAALRDLGVDVQTSNIFSRMFVALRDSPKPTRQDESQI
jgi:hypothetical protein